jgi:transposase
MMSRMQTKSAGRRARRRFTPEFKAGAIRLVLDEGKTIGAVARELDLTPSAPGSWVARAQADRPGRKLNLSRQRRAQLKLQGKYMGYLRALRPKQKAEVKRVREKMGVQASISRAKQLMGKKAA